VLAQTFEELATGARFTVAVNHLKSKGSACAGDPDTGDGQGNCNVTRTLAAQALVDWLATDPTGSGDPDFLIVGDLNSYAMEDPIDAIRAGADDTPGTADDYVNLISHFGGPYAYSYVFDGMAGYLDHALASSSIFDQVTDAADWHINADEPDLLDYDTSFKPPAQEAIYEPNAFRSSDHDPVLVGLDLAAAPEITSLSGPSAFAVDTPQTFVVTFTDLNGADSHTVGWDWGDGSTSTTTASGGSSSATHTWATPGFYTVTVTVTDEAGLSDSASLEVAVFDPDTGKVTGGGGWADGSFEISVQNRPNLAAPRGSTELTVPGGTLVATSYDWLLVEANRATFQGEGTFNGTPGYGFLVSVIDGGSPGRKDRIRVWIWDEDGDTVYDSQPGAPASAAPTAQPTSGNLVVHKVK
jgi:PKD repeat protein